MKLFVSKSKNTAMVIVKKALENCGFLVDVLTSDLLAYDKRSVDQRYGVKISFSDFGPDQTKSENSEITRLIEQQTHLYYRISAVDSAIKKSEDKRKELMQELNRLEDKISALENK